MRDRVLGFFWGATAASVLLLGAVWTLKDRVGDAGFGAWEIVLIVIAGVGFCVTFFVAARIAWVIGRWTRTRRVDRVLMGGDAR